MRSLINSLAVPSLSFVSPVMPNVPHPTFLSLKLPSTIIPSDPADQCINNFLDSARQLEVFFLKKRLLLCRDKPENILKEEIENIEAEIERKNQVVTKHKERLATWQQKLADVGKPKPETTSTATTTSSTSSTTTPASAASTPPTTTTSQASNTSGRHVEECFRLEQGKISRSLL